LLQYAPEKEVLLKTAGGIREYRKMETGKISISLRKKIALCAVSIVFMYATGEIAVRCLRLPERLPASPPKAGPQFAWATYNPAVGWINTPGFSGRHVRTNMFDVSVKINSGGLRNDREYGYERKPGVFRAVVLGDSFTFGHGVDNDKTYAADLESMIPESEVLNAGVQGWGHDQQLLWLKEEGLKYRPDLIIWGFSSADIPRNVNIFRRLSDLTTGLDYAKPRYIVKDGKLELTNFPAPPPGDMDRLIANYLGTERAKRSLFNRIMRHSRFFTAIDDAIDTLAEKKEQVVLAEAIVREFALTAKKAGIPLVIVHLPVRKWLESMSPIVTAKRKTTEGLLVRVSAETGAPVLDLRTAFLAKGRNEIGSYFIKDGHYSEAGNKLVAEELHNYIKRTLPAAITPPEPK